MVRALPWWLQLMHRLLRSMAPWWILLSGARRYEAAVVMIFKG